MPPEWLEALASLGTDWHKPFLEAVPWIVVVFEEIYQVGPKRQRLKSYYAKESVGIAAGCHRRPPSDGPGNSHAHTQPHGVPFKDPWSTSERTAVHPFPGRLPRG